MALTPAAPSLVTSGYASHQGWPAVVPAWAMAGGVGATLFIGALAGLYPAVRAARLSPTRCPDRGVGRLPGLGPALKTRRGALGELDKFIDNGLAAA